MGWEDKLFLFIKTTKMKYKCLNNNVFENNEFCLVPLRQQDLIDIMHWRNAQIDVLRQKVLLTESHQISYFENHIKPTFNLEKPNQILFSYLFNNICIGYGGLTNIDWESKRIEMSFLLNDKLITDSKKYSNYFSEYIKLLKKVVFDELKFNRIFTETYDIRDNHIKTLETNGFVFEGRLREHVFINDKFVDSLIHGFNLNQYLNER